MKDKTGFVETPREIAEVMVSLISKDRDAFLLDTGTGRGVFLEVLKERGFRNCYGIELDEELYDFCRKKFSSISIIHGDFLGYKFHRQFDVIIGNPPYIHFSNLPPAMAESVFRILKNAETDIYYAFIIKAITLLKDGGELIYIVPYHFFYNTNAGMVRECILKHGRIEIIIDLDEANLFKKEKPETIIFKFIKGSFSLREATIKVFRLKNRKESIRNIASALQQSLQGDSYHTAVFDVYEIPHFLSPQNWSLQPVSISFPYRKVGELAKTGVGPVSGYDRAFAISQALLPSFLKEEGFLKKFVKAKNCNRWKVEGYVYYIFTGSNLDEEELRAKSPNIYRHLLSFREKLEKRYLPENRKWFAWQAERNYRFLIRNFEKRRIYVPCLSRKRYSRFCLGEGGLLPSGDVLFLQPYREQDLYPLLAYLNSEVFFSLYLSFGGRRGGRIVFTQRLLEHMPVPVFTEEEIQKLTYMMEELLAHLHNGDTEKIQKEINRMMQKKTKAIHNGFSDISSWQREDAF